MEGKPQKGLQRYGYPHAAVLRFLSIVVMVAVSTYMAFATLLPVEAQATVPQQQEQAAPAEQNAAPGAEEDGDAGAEASAESSEGSESYESAEPDENPEPSPPESEEELDNSDFTHESQLGDKGRLFIPDVGVDVAVYDGPIEDEEKSQAICDAEDSAVLLGWEPIPLIGDHNNQGFEAIKWCVPGQTHAYLETTDGYVLDFLCTDLFVGTNNFNAYYENEKAITATGDCDLVMYTCNETSIDITLVTWEEQGTDRSAAYLKPPEPVEEEPAEIIALIPVPEVDPADDEMNEAGDLFHRPRTLPRFKSSLLR